MIRSLSYEMVDRSIYLYIYYVRRGVPCLDTMSILLSPNKQAAQTTAYTQCSSHVSYDEVGRLDYATSQDDGDDPNNNTHWDIIQEQPLPFHAIPNTRCSRWMRGHEDRGGKRRNRDERGREDWREEENIGINVRMILPLSLLFFSSTI